jgi:hypothetical protein
VIGAFVARLSLNLTLALLKADVVYKTLPITDATVATPIVVTSAAHGVPLGRVVHGVVDGVVGTVEANGLWVLTPLDADTFSLSTYDAQGLPVDSVGANAYDSGGTIYWSFPDGQILLGRRNVHLATQVATPRIVMIPTAGAAWDFQSYGGAAPSIVPAVLPNVRGSAEQQSMKLSPQIATEHLTFEVYVNGSGPNFGDALDPDFADFDATQRVVHMLYAELFDATGGRARILREAWPSQVESQGAMTQRGQQWMGVLDVQMPVTRAPLSFVPIGTRAEITVEPLNAGSTDPVVIVVPHP